VNRLQKKITPIKDGDYIYKIKYLKERNINIPKNILRISVTKNNIFILTENGNLYKNNTLYEKDCLHIYEYSNKKDICENLCFIYKGHKIENYVEHKQKQKIQYDKVLFGYNYVVILKEKRVKIMNQTIIDFFKKISSTIELILEDIDDCNIYLEPVFLKDFSEIYDEENCVDVLELTKNQEKMIIPFSCIDLTNG